jgi:outer membrane protein insertion porin family
MRKFFACFFLLLLFLPVALCVAQPSGSDDPASQDSSKLIKSILVTGNKAISTETIMAKIKTRVGQPYYAQASRDDIKRLYEMGFFSDISLDLEDESGGLKVIFKVVERPIVQEIAFAGQKLLTRRFFISKMKTKQGQYLSLAILKEDIAMIKNEYEKRGLPQVDVIYEETAEPETNKSKLLVTIKEGQRIVIKKLYIDGNLHFKDGRILSLIKTRQKKFFNPGVYKEEQLVEDLERIKGFYLKNGYLDVMVDYRIDYNAEGKMVLRVMIEEGRSYSVGAVVIAGNEVFSEKEVAGSLKSCLKGATFTYDALKEDVANIQSFYFGKGYIFVQVHESTSLDSASGKVDVTYAIVENDEVYVDRVEIRGNLKTQDKVIRRELRIKPGEKFDGDKLKRSKERLYNLGYFEEVNYDTEPGSGSNKRNLVVDVKEAKTGSLSFGGGYSSIDQLVGFVEIEQKNFDWRNWKTFTGGGQDLKLRAEMGQVRQDFDLSFTEPWWLDYPISFGFDVYKRTHEKEADVGYGYREERNGGDLRLAKEFSEYIKGGATYRIEQVNISDVDSTATVDLKAEEGKNWISSV